MWVGLVFTKMTDNMIFSPSHSSSVKWFRLPLTEQTERKLEESLTKRRPRTERGSVLPTSDWWHPHAGGSWTTYWMYQRCSLFSWNGDFMYILLASEFCFTYLLFFYVSILFTSSLLLFCEFLKHGLKNKYCCEIIK